MKSAFSVVVPLIVEHVEFGDEWLCKLRKETEAAQCVNMVKRKIIATLQNFGLTSTTPVVSHRSHHLSSHISFPLSNVGLDFVQIWFAPESI